MSRYEELKQFVAALSGDTYKNAEDLVKCADNVKTCAAMFERLTATTQGNSAKAVGQAFQEAEKQLLIAARFLVEAAKAGYDWSEGFSPELNLVLKPRSR